MQNYVNLKHCLGQKINVGLTGPKLSHFTLISQAKSLYEFE